MHSLLNDFIEYEKLKGHTDKTIFKKGRELKKFIASSGKSPELITKEDIVSYLENQEHENSYNRKLSYLYQFFDYLLEHDEVLINPAVTIERHKTVKGNHSGIFTEDEIKAIMDTTLPTAVGKRDKAILELFYSTGMRISELIYLNIHDIDLRNNEIFIINGKFDRERIVPVGDKTVKAIRVYLRVREKFLSQEKEHEALFLSMYGSRISESGVRNMIERRKKEAGITANGSTHAFRHSCASHMLKNGAPLPMIQRLLGHEDLHATEMYAHIYDNDFVQKMKASEEV